MYYLTYVPFSDLIVIFFCRLNISIFFLGKNIRKLICFPKLAQKALFDESVFKKGLGPNKIRQKVWNCTCTELCKYLFNVCSIENQLDKNPILNSSEKNHTEVMSCQKTIY